MRNVKRLVAKLQREVPEPPVTEETLQRMARADFAAVRAVIAKHGPFRSADSATHPACVALAALPHWRDATPDLLCFFAGYYARVLADETGGSAERIARLCGESK